MFAPYIAVRGFKRTFRRRNGLSSGTDGQISWHVFHFSRHVKIGPARKGPGYYPRENFDIFDARMFILECIIGIVYGDDNMEVVGFVVETGGGEGI